MVEIVLEIVVSSGVSEVFLHDVKEKALIRLTEIAAMDKILVAFMMNLFITYKNDSTIHVPKENYSFIILILCHLYDFIT
jgi:hypothetical protein